METDTRHIDPERIAESFSALGPGTTVTSGKYECVAHCDVEDLDWNHMDQDHRPWIHGTYQEAVRIYTSGNVAVSLTRLRMGPFKLSVLLTDVRIRPGLFYQSYSLFNLIYVHGVLRNRPEKMTFEWHIVSPWYFRWLHGWLGRKIYRLNHVQIAQDIPIRTRRRELREKGYDFGRSPYDFLTSNGGRLNTSYPPSSGRNRFRLDEVAPGEPKQFEAGALRVLVVQEDPETYRIWNAVCPHEGGPLESGRLCDSGRQIECPWHGLKFPGVIVREGGSASLSGGVRVGIDENCLVVDSG